jgi:hypothetical protein
LLRVIFSLAQSFSSAQRWLKSLHENNGLAWTTIAKMRGVMHRIYKIGILHEHVAKNPAQHVETRSKTDYKAVVITPTQTLAILKALPSPLHFTLVLTCAATAPRASPKTVQGILRHAKIQTTLVFIDPPSQK